MSWPMFESRLFSIPLDGELLLFFLWLLLLPVPALARVVEAFAGLAAAADGAWPFAFFLRTFFVFGSLWSFFHFIRRF
jgi:hypothetical protein